MNVRVTDAEYRMLLKTAEREGERLSQWVRAAIFERLEKVTRKKPKG